MPSRFHLSAGAWRALGVLLEAGALGLILATQVTTGFVPFRVKVVTAPVAPASGVARSELPGSTSAATLSTPLAVIVRVRNDAPEAARFDVRVDGVVICSRTVRGGGQPERLDCALAGPWDSRASHTVEIVGPPSDAWALMYLEAATHHGATRGFDLVVVPARFRGHARTTFASGSIAWLALVAILLLPRASWPRAAIAVHRTACGIVALLLIVAFASRYFSPYSVLLSRKAFFALVAVLAAPRLWPAGEWIWGPASTNPRRLLASLTTGLVVIGTYGVVIHERLEKDYGGNYSGFVHITRATFDRHPALRADDEVRRSLALAEDWRSGYDAQFVYYAVFDPLLRAYRASPETYGHFIDAPPYRYGRIGFSMLTRGVAGNRWRVYPAVMVWTILLSLFLCGVLLAALAQSHGSTAGWGLLVILVPPFWQSAQFALPEPLATALLLAGFILLRHERPAAGAAFLAASLLVRETGAVFVTAMAAGLWLSNRRRDGAVVLLVSIVPLIGWRLYMGGILAPVWGAQAYWFNAGNLGVPFGGLVDLWGTIAQGAYYPDTPGLARAAAGLAALLFFGLVLSFVLAIRKPGAMATSSVIYALMAVSLTYSSIWVHVGNAQRGAYEVFVMLALLGLDARTLPRGLRLSLVAFWAATGAYTFFGAYDAEYIRNAIL